MTDNCTWDRLC